MLRCGMKNVELDRPDAFPASAPSAPFVYRRIGLCFVSLDFVLSY